MPLIYINQILFHDEIQFNLNKNDKKFNFEILEQKINNKQINELYNGIFVCSFTYIYSLLCREDIVTELMYTHMHIQYVFVSKMSFNFAYISDNDDDHLRLSLIIFFCSHYSIIIIDINIYIKNVRNTKTHQSMNQPSFLLLRPKRKILLVL